MGKMSRQKGKGGEREVAAMLRGHGFEAKRGVQYQGGPDSQDVKHNIPGIHIEVKRVEALNMNSAMKQARADAKSEDVPVVFHRKSHEPWLVTLDAEEFLLMQRRLHPLVREINAVLDIAEEEEVRYPLHRISTGPDEGGIEGQL